MPINVDYNSNVDGLRVGLQIDGFGYSDVLSNNVCYTGSQFQIQEIATITIDITDPKLIDVDHRFFTPNKYIGTWQVLRDTGLTIGGLRIFGTTGTNDPEFQGRITDTEFKLFRTSTHTIGDTTSERRASDVITLDACNTATGEFSFTFGGLSGSFSDFVDKEGVYTGRLFEKPPPLEDREFFTQLRSIGLYLNPGAEFVSATYTAAAINVLSSQGTILVEKECQTRNPQVDCIALVTAWIADNPTYYIDPVSCEIASGGIPCVQEEIFLDTFCGVSFVYRPFVEIPTLPGN